MQHNFSADSQESVYPGYQNLGQEGLGGVVDRMDRKDRILEVYLNVVEFGPGVYGVGAASREYFNLAPGMVGRDDAATLAACLPAPLVNRPGGLSPQARIRRKAIVERIRTSYGNRNQPFAE